MRAVALTVAFKICFLLANLKNGCLGHTKTVTRGDTCVTYHFLKHAAIFKLAVLSPPKAARNIFVQRSTLQQDPFWLSLDLRSLRIIPDTLQQQGFKQQKICHRVAKTIAAAKVVLTF